MKETFCPDKIIILLIILVLISGCNKKDIPVLTTNDVNSITSTTAKSGGTIISDGGYTIDNRGVCWSTLTNPTIKNSKTIDGAGAGSFISEISGLEGGTTYYIRAYATNNSGTGYGMAMSFKTLGQKANAVTNDATSIEATQARLNGLVNANYLSTTVTFEFGTSISYGQVISPPESPVTGNTDTYVSIDVLSLSPLTTYHFRIKTINSLGTTYGSDKIFTTVGQKPLASTLDVTNKKPTSATLNGSVNAKYLSTVVTFEYGTTTNYGQTATAIESPVIGNSNKDVSANISNLLSSTVYHFRVKAVNSLGTAYGTDITFSTLFGTVNDIDGNIYSTVKIGNQLWMAENLKTTKYRDGSVIPNIISQTEWKELTSGAYCWLNNDATKYKNVYGALYNWYTVNTEKLCPTGWHIPSDTEWTVLINSLGGNQVAGGSMKEIGETHWMSSNGATNISGFTALPGGSRHVSGFGGPHSEGFWWSSTEYDIQFSWNREIRSYNAGIAREYSPKLDGLSVRCVKD